MARSVPDGAAKRPRRGWLRRALRFVFPTGAPAGLAFYGGLFLWSVLTREGFAAFGVRDASIEKLVFGQFFGTVVSVQVQILSAYLVLGWALGALAGQVVRWGPRAFGWRSPTRWGSRWAAVLTLLVIGHFVQLGRAIAEYPQLFTESLYDHGGWRASQQVALTDLPVWLFDIARVAILGGSLLAIFLGVRRDGYVTEWKLRWRGLPERTRRVLAATLLLLVVLAAAWRLWPVRASGAGPNVLFIAVDSLRADRVSHYGAKRKTPALDALAEGGTAFEKAYVSLPRTFPSWTTLLTGEWPHRHGIRHMFPTRAERARIPKTFVHAAAQAGYQTSVVGDYAADIFPRIDYGFQRVSAPYIAFPTLIGLRSFELHKQLLPYVTNPLGRRLFPVLQELAQNADPRELGDRAIAELRHLAPRGKFFMTLFFSAAHFPYSVPSPYYKLYTNAAYGGKSKYQKIHQLGRGEALTDADVQQIQDLYDGAVKSIDDQLARIFAALDDLGAAKNTLVVVLADHGEHLHEAKLGMGHGEHLRGDAALRIPLIVRGPGVPVGARVKGLVRDVDLVPTLAALTGVQPIAPVDGTDVGPMMRGEKADLGLELYAETGLWFVDDGEDFFQKQRLPYPPLTALGRLDRDFEIVLNEKYADMVLVAKHRVVQTATHKLIYAPTREGVRYELYDLVADPAQARDVSGEQKDVLQKLKDKLFKWMLAAPNVFERREFVLPIPKAQLTRVGAGGGSGG